MTFNINEWMFQKECDSIARDIVADILGYDLDTSPEDQRDAVLDAVHTTVDGHQWVIYHHKAIKTAAECNVDAGEEFVEDVGLPSPLTFGGFVSAIVYGEMRARVEAEVERLLDDLQTPWDAWQDAKDEAEMAQDEADAAESEESNAEAQDRADAAQEAAEKSKEAYENAVAGKTPEDKGEAA